MTGSGASPPCGTISCSVNYVCTVQLNWDDSKAGGLADQSSSISAKL
jgi:hypothetical protein